MGYDDFYAGIFFGGLSGILCGAGLIGILNFVLPDADKVKVFKEEGKHSVTRLYRPGRDQILIEDLNVHNRTDYVRLGQYLKTIKDPADRALEEARIKKQVDWYK